MSPELKYESIYTGHTQRENLVTIYASQDKKKEDSARMIKYQNTDGNKRRTNSTHFYNPKAPRHLNMQIRL